MRVSMSRFVALTLLMFLLSQMTIAETVLHEPYVKQRLALFQETLLSNADELAELGDACVGLYFSEDFFVYFIPKLNRSSGIELGDRLIEVNGFPVVKESPGSRFATFERKATADSVLTAKVRRGGETYEYSFRCADVRKKSDAPVSLASDKKHLSMQMLSMLSILM